MHPPIAPQSCPSCGHILELSFCPNCGEKRVNHHDFSLKHFAEEAVEGVTHFDNKFFRTLTILMTKPGKLSEEFSNGIRTKYMKPLQLYIVCNLFFFIGIIFWNPFAQPLNSYWNYRPYTVFGSREIITKKMIEAKSTFRNEYDESGALSASLPDNYFYSLVEEKFNRSIKSQSKIFLIVLIPLYALTFMIFFSRKRFVGEHFVLATHFMAALLVYYIFAAYLINLPLNYFLGENNPVGDIISVTFIFVYLGLAFKRFYKVPVWRSILATLCVTSVTIVIWSFYRMLLFYNIMYWM